METRLKNCFALIVCDIDLGALRPILDQLRIKAFTLQQLRKEFVVQRGSDGGVLSVEKPALFVGALAASRQGAQTLNEAQSELELFFGQACYDLFDLHQESDRDGAAGVSAWLVERLLLVGTDLLQDGMRVRQSLVTLRRDHEEALERFAELEGITYRFSTPKRVAKLNYPPSQARVGLRIAPPQKFAPNHRGVRQILNRQMPQTGPSGSSQPRVRQVLPTRASGLASIDLYLDGTVAGHGGRIKVDLFLGTSTAPAHCWTLHAGQLRGGWLPLHLDKALVTGEQDATIEITWDGPEGSSVSLALTQPNPIAEYCAVMDRKLRLQAPLAVRVWGMPPGSTVTSTEAAGPAGPVEAIDSRQAGGSTQFALAANELVGVVLAGPTDVDLDLDVVAFRDSELDIVVHPIRGRTTVGILRDLRLRDVRGLSALVLIEHEESKPIEFGLAIVPQQATYAKPETLIRQWTAVEPLIYTEVPGTVDTKAGAPLDLLLATRMFNNADTRYAWARFKRVEVTAGRS